MSETKQQIPDSIQRQLDAGVPVVASVSGGKDSAALCLFLREQGIPYRAVHMDTGWEHPDTDEYILTVLEREIGPIEWIKPPCTFPELVRREGIFPHGKTRFCTKYLKLFPFFEWIEEQYGTKKIVNAQGIRAGESAARADLPEDDDESAYGITWRPLLRCSEQDVIEIHQRHGLAPNPLYLRGCRRVGCWPCVYADKEAIRLVANTDPGRIDEIRELEAEIGKRYPGASFFYKHGWAAPIDEYVAWSRTSHGGKALELFDADTDRSGCMRWGMCDV